MRGRAARKCCPARERQAASKGNTGLADASRVRGRATLILTTRGLALLAGGPSGPSAGRSRLRSCGACFMSPLIGFAPCLEGMAAGHRPTGWKLLPRGAVFRRSRRVAGGLPPLRDKRSGRTIGLLLRSGWAPQLSGACVGGVRSQSSCEACFAWISGARLIDRSRLRFPGWVPPTTGLVLAGGGADLRSRGLPHGRLSVPNLARRYACIRLAGCPQPEGLVSDGGGGGFRQQGLPFSRSPAPDLACRDRPNVLGWAPQLERPCARERRSRTSTG
jgi:hypothetical protein